MAAAAKVVQIVSRLKLIPPIFLVTWSPTGMFTDGMPTARVRVRTCAASCIAGPRFADPAALELEERHERVGEHQGLEGRQARYEPPAGGARHERQTDGDDGARSEAEGDRAGEGLAVHHAFGRGELQ